MFGNYFTSKNKIVKLNVSYYYTEGTKISIDI